MLAAGHVSLIWRVGLWIERLFRVLWVRTGSPPYKN